MTKQQKWTPESPIEAWATTYESLAKALGGLQNKFEIPDAHASSLSIPPPPRRMAAPICTRAPTR
jgi:hypothetical protein